MKLVTIKLAIGTTAPDCRGTVTCCQPPYCFVTNSLGVRPVTWRKAWEKAGTLA